MGDLGGGFGCIADLADMASRIHVNMNKKAELCRAIARDNAAEFEIINGAEVERVRQTVNITLRANQFPLRIPPTYWGTYPLITFSVT